MIKGNYINKTLFHAKGSLDKKFQEMWMGNQKIYMEGETISTYAFAEKPAKWNSVSNKMKSIIGIIKLNVDKK